MGLDNHENWKEVISKEDFHLILHQFLNKKNESEKSLETLETISEKYTKFYENILTKEEVESINVLLIKFTDFGNLNRMETLTALLFNFKINEYYDYLLKHYFTIINQKVKKEISDTLSEYKSLMNK
ncbi:MAG: hypothetical protein ABIP30_10000 [Ferruginibacter sp.]